MSMNIRKGHGRDIASRIDRIQHLAEAAATLVDAGAHERAQGVLDDIAENITEHPNPLAEKYNTEALARIRAEEKLDLAIDDRERQLKSAATHAVARYKAEKVVKAVRDLADGWSRSSDRCWTSNRAEDIIETIEEAERA